MPDDLPVLSFGHPGAWAAWLDRNHRTSSGVWLRLARKGSGGPSLSYDDALDAALCYGWIDGRKRSDGEQAWLQKFTPRGRRSPWSKRNREKALALIEAGRMRPAGLEEVERAKADGRWDAAYDSPRTAAVPEDFQAALARNGRARAAFAALDSRNRYAMLHRLQTARKPETRARRIEQFVGMLERNEKLYP